MKPSRPKEERIFDQSQRGLAAQRIKDDDLIQAWFDAEHARLVTAMLQAEIADDQKRRDCALQIKTLSNLRQHIETEAALGKAALKQMESSNG